MGKGSPIITLEYVASQYKVWNILWEKDCKEGQIIRYTKGYLSKGWMCNTVHNKFFLMKKENSHTPRSYQGSLQQQGKAIYKPWSIS